MIRWTLYNSEFCISKDDIYIGRIQHGSYGNGTPEFWRVIPSIDSKIYLGEMVWRDFATQAEAFEFLTGSRQIDG